MDDSTLVARTTTSGCGGGQRRDKVDMSAHVIAVSQHFTPLLFHFQPIIIRTARSGVVAARNSSLDEFSEELFHMILAAGCTFLCIRGGGLSGGEERRVMP